MFDERHVLISGRGNTFGNPGDCFLDNEILKSTSSAYAIRTYDPYSKQWYILCLQSGITTPIEQNHQHLDMCQGIPSRSNNMGIFVTPYPRRLRVFDATSLKTIQNVHLSPMSLRLCLHCSNLAQCPQTGRQISSSIPKAFSKVHQGVYPLHQYRCCTRTKSLL